MKWFIMCWRPYHQCWRSYHSLRGALDQLALMVMQTGIGLSRADTIAYAASVIDLVVQLERNEGKRGISAIAWSRDLL